MVDGSLGRRIRARPNSQQDCALPRTAPLGSLEDDRLQRRQYYGGEARRFPLMFYIPSEAPVAVADPNARSSRAADPPDANAWGGKWGDWPENGRNRYTDQNCECRAKEEKGKETAVGENATQGEREEGGIGAVSDIPKVETAAVDRAHLRSHRVGCLTRREPHCRCHSRDP